MVQAVQRGVGNHVRHIAVPCGRLLAARLPVGLDIREEPVELAVVCSMNRSNQADEIAWLI